MSSEPKKLLFVCTEDWFFFSHFRPLVKAAKQAAIGDIALVTTTSGKHKELEALGVRIIPLDFERASLNGLSALKLVRRLALRFRQEKPDLIHFISLKPIILGGLAAHLSSSSATIYHLTGQGYLTVSRSRRDCLMKGVFSRLIGHFLRRPNSWLLLENPQDGETLKKLAPVVKDRHTLLGGAGVDTDEFPALEMLEQHPPRAGFVGRMVWSKGVDVLIAALDNLKQRRIPVHLDLYGDPDLQNPRALTIDELAAYNNRDDVQWHGRVHDIVAVWRDAAIAVFPSRGGEGLPRSLLEAASCARPVIVTDVPGCGRFVRDGIEGFVVPPDDAIALADALARLAVDAELRQRMGEAARRRVLEGFTENHVIASIATVYTGLIKEQKTFRTE